MKLTRFHIWSALLGVFLVALPLAGFLQSEGFLGLALGSLVVALILANAE